MHRGDENDREKKVMKYGAQWWDLFFSAILTSFIFAHDIDVTLDFKHSVEAAEKKSFCSRARGTYSPISCRL